MIDSVAGEQNDYSNVTVVSLEKVGDLERKFGEQSPPRIGGERDK